MEAEESSEITKLQDTLKAEQEAHLNTKRELHQTMMIIAKIPEGFRMMGQGFTGSATELFNYAQLTQNVLNAYWTSFTKNPQEVQKRIAGANQQQQQQQDQQQGQQQQPPIN